MSATMPDAAWQGRRALVLGASGFIGRWVGRRLAAAGARVVSAVRDPESFMPVMDAWKIGPRLRVFDAIDDPVSELVAQVKPDIVFNLLGYGVDRTETDPAVMHQINAELPAALARALAARGGIRLVHVGSALEYGLLHGEAAESAACEPHTPYGHTKLAGTKAVVDAVTHAGLDGIVVRLFTVFGAGEHDGRLLPTLMAAAGTGEVVRLSGGHQRRDFTYVDDVADGLRRLAEAGRQREPVVNLATGRLTTVRDFAETAAQILGIPADRLQFGAESLRPDEMRLTSVSVDRLHALTGWAPEADLRVSIRRAVAFEAG